MVAGLLVYVRIFGILYAAYKIPRSGVVFVMGKGFGGYMNPDQVLAEFTPERVAQESDPDLKHLYINSRRTAEEAIRRAHGQGLLAGILSLNLFWIPVFLVRRRRRKSSG